jgi:hypothetical protein
MIMVSVNSFLRACGVPCFSNNPLFLSLLFAHSPHFIR